jgi:CheY-like chemotaxis protein/HPt (histidine-containing phosphotransfer) domain-containing protein
MVDLALGEELSPTLQDYLQTAKQSADGLLQLVNEILDLSRIEAGAVQLEATPFDLRQTVEQVVKALGVPAYEKGLELVCDLDDVPTQLVGDPLRLRQVLVNLVGNAVKFTSRGEVIVRVEVVPDAAGVATGADRAAPVSPGEETSVASDVGRIANPSSNEAGFLDGLPIRPTGKPTLTLQFAVADTGVGIAPVDQGRIFAPFTQADASTTRQYGGTGLGLTIARRLVDLMGGRIWVQSEPGKGSIFRFTACFGLQERQEQGPGTTAAVGEALRELPVLVVAENPAGGRILVETLQRWSMKAELAEDVSAALAKIRQAAGDGQSFRLILADAVMPGLDGFTLAQQLQSDAPLAGPVILMLAAPQRHSRAKRCRDLGALCLEKPVSQSDLLSLIVEALGIRQQAVKAADAAQAAVSPVASRSLRVLLAEDTPANQKLAGYLLNKRGHRVELVQNGRQALEAVGREEFDAVLMDLQMPVMDGLQATRAIRKLQDPKRARLPIIAMTAHALKGDLERCLAAGMDGYISKPIKRDELIEMVERLAEKTTGGALASAAAPDRSASPSPQPMEAQPPDEAASATAPASVFDLDLAVRRCFGKYRLFRDMARCLFDEADPLLEKMRTALADGNGVELANAAHRLKGTVGYLGAAPAMDAVRSVEQMGKRGELTGAAGAIRQLEEQLAILKQAIAPHRR